MSNLDVTVPSLGESITEAVIAKWLKKEGEIVNKDEVIAELETDKVTQEIYSPKAGIIKKIFFQEGEEVKIGETIVNIEEKNIDDSYYFPLILALVGFSSLFVYLLLVRTTTELNKLKLKLMG